MPTQVLLLTCTTVLFFELYYYYHSPVKHTSKYIREICNRGTIVGAYDWHTAHALEDYLVHIFRVILFAHPDINCCDFAMQWNKECNRDPNNLLALAIIHAWNNTKDSTYEPDFELFNTLPKCLLYNDYIDLCSFERRVHSLCQE